MPEFLLELLSEEIPARMQARAADDLKKLFTDKLKDAGLEHKKVDAYVTPRRLVLRVDGLPEQQPDLREEKKGPRVGAPEVAIAGFLKSVSLASLDQCEKRVVGKAEFWFAAIERKGRPTPELLPAMVAEIVAAFAWPKSMRWAATSFRWVRPLRNVLCLWNGAPLEGAIALAEDMALTFAGTTVGHRFLAPEPFAVTGFADYKTKLKMRNVVVDQTERRATIDIETKRVASDLMLKLRDDPGLLDEVTGLVEWPVVLAGEIDQRFMDVPPEVLVTAMRAHQKYFALAKADGSLAPRFIVVANIEGDDKLKATIVAGNERVLKARLSDAKFFWDQDRKVALETRVPLLASRIFYAGLGTMADKVERLRKLGAVIAKHVHGAEAAKVDLAARLCKADLASGMVGEFPELQGVMGRYYALHEKLDQAVADAVRDHYAPLGPNDRCPAAPVSVTVALADKLDTLAGFFALGEKPTGSKDPFALRRAALGVIRLVVENKLCLPLRPTLSAALMYVPVPTEGERRGQVIDELLAFFADRLKVALREQGVRHDLIDAVFALGGEDDLVRLLARVDALKGFVISAEGIDLLAAYKRAANIVAIEQKKDGARYTGAPDVALLELPEEKELAAALDAARPAVDAALKAENFTDAMRVLSTLRGPVDAFFDKVTVNAPEAKLRANRLRMLAAIGAALRAVADFSRIEG
jgi:glycyl-tRNA synthetase beta chain